MLLPTTRSLAVLTVALLSAVPAWAADIQAVSKIDAATIFPLGAEVTRVLKVRIPAGEHTVVLKDLPQSAIAPSIRVEAKATGALAIGAVDTQRAFIAEAETAITAVERRQLEAEIEKLNDEKARHGADIEAAQAQKKLIASIADGATRPVPVGTAAPQQPDWAALGSLVATQTAAAQRAILEAQLRIRESDKKIGELQKKLAPIAPAQVERTEVRIAVTAATPLEADVIVRYQVQQAAWTPFYDARLTTGSKTAAPKLQLVRRASIQQRTGEAWDNIALTLSTTRPSQGSQAPDLAPMLVDLFDPTVVRQTAPMSAPAPMAAPEPRALQDRARLNAAGARGDADAPAKAKEAVAVQATIDGNAFQALYGIPGRHTVPMTNETKRVQIDQSDLDNVPLTVRTVPKRDARAFLYAKLKVPATTAILPGQVSLFRDGTFVGNARLPQLAPTEDHELGFGQDDNVRVKYAVVDEKRGETGIITTSRTEAKSFKISVKSLHERPIQVRVTDQFPVAQNQDIKVETNTKVAPTGKDPDDKRGLVYWDFELKTDEERTLDFGYRMTWPAAKQISGR
jgi:uncharacterized protein (TIGR02231 family)